VQREAVQHVGDHCVVCVDRHKRNQHDVGFSHPDCR
jgi:hypothetical protein